MDYIQEVDDGGVLSGSGDAWRFIGISDSDLLKSTRTQCQKIHQAAERRIGQLSEKSLERKQLWLMIYYLSILQSLLNWRTPDNHRALVNKIRERFLPLCSRQDDKGLFNSLITEIEIDIKTLETTTANSQEKHTSTKASKLPITLLVILLSVLIAIISYLVIRTKTDHISNSPNRINHSTRIVQKNGARVRAQANFSAKEITMLRSGQSVKVLGTRGEWLQVEIQLRNKPVAGWMHQSLFEKDVPANMRKGQLSSETPIAPSIQQSDTIDSASDVANSLPDSRDRAKAVAIPGTTEPSADQDSSPDPVHPLLRTDQAEVDQKSSTGEPSLSYTRRMNDQSQQPQLEPPLGTVIDFENGLMWMAADNQESIDWDAATDYCANLTFGGFEDWRLPNLREALNLYQRAPDAEAWSDRAGEPRFGIELSACCVWTSTLDRKSRPLFYSKNYGKSGRLVVRAVELPQMRALCARTIQQ